MRLSAHGATLPLPGQPLKRPLLEYEGASAWAVFRRIAVSIDFAPCMPRLRADSKKTSGQR